MNRAAQTPPLSVADAQCRPARRRAVSHRRVRLPGYAARALS